MKELYLIFKVFLEVMAPNKKWLTYNINPKQLFSYLCLAFSSESNNFTKGIGKCVVSYYNILQKYNLYYDTYSNLFLTYKLPSTEVLCEKSFFFHKKY